MDVPVYLPDWLQLGGWFLINIFEGHAKWHIRLKVLSFLFEDMFSDLLSQATPVYCYVSLHILSRQRWSNEIERVIF